MRAMRGYRVMGAVLVAIALVACGVAPDPMTNPASLGPDGGPALAPGETARPRAPTVPGHEIYGFLPYWEMDGKDIVEQVAGTPLTTLGLFSVTHTAKGAINTKQRGHTLISGDVGTRLIRGAHERGVRVELVYSSFGGARNRKLLESPELQATVIASLVAYASKLGVDGINVDMEALDPTLVPAYGGFVRDLRAAVRVVDPTHTVSVATGGHALGAAMALAAAAAGADRIFLMGYDYRTGRSEPGASAPLDRSDGGTASLRNSLDMYAALGVPADRLLLGLPLYGVEWPVAGPVIGAPSTGRGQPWFPRANVELLTDPTAIPLRDDVEQVEVYLIASDGTIGPPTPQPETEPSPSVSPGSSAAPVPERTWRAIYVDSPATLAPKMALANERGLAGSGFWAIGYEQGLPGYTHLMERFMAGDPVP